MKNANSNHTKNCPKCSSENVNATEYSDTVDFRGLELDVEKLQDTKCENCGYSWVTASQQANNSAVTRASYAVQRDFLRKKDGLLSGSEIAQIREKFELSQREAATIFGGGFNAFNKYESGEVLQSYAMDRLLRLSKVVGKPAIEFLRNVFAKSNFFVISGGAQGTSTITLVQIDLGKLNPAALVKTHKTIGDQPPAEAFSYESFGKFAGVEYKQQVGYAKQ